MKGPKMFGTYLTGDTRQRAIKAITQKLGPGVTILRTMDALKRHGRHHVTYYRRMLYVLVKYRDGHLRWAGADVDSAGRLRYWCYYGTRPDGWELAQ